MSISYETQQSALIDRQHEVNELPSYDSALAL